MRIRGSICVALVALALGGAASVAAAPPDGHEETARELAGLMLDDNLRRLVQEQVGVRLMQAIAATLETRLDRRLLEVERVALAGIVTRFVTDTLPPSRTEELAARVYARHFSEDELQELLRFQRSAVGRRAATLAPLIATETAREIDAEVQTSPALPQMIESLQQEFPVLRVPQSP